MRGSSLAAQDRAMFTTPEPFLSAEISYRQQRVTDSFKKRSGRRRYRVPRRRTLKVPQQRPGTVAVA
jgi:hypothetical protein